MSNNMDNTDLWKLREAASKGDAATLKQILDKGVNPNWETDTILTTLTCAVRSDSAECVTLLLDRGANPNLGDKYGDTPLMYIAMCNDLQMMKILLDNGAEIDIRDNDGQTALMKAANYGSMKAVEFLLNAGADANAKDYKGRTALLLARGYPDIIGLLKQYGAKEQQSQTDHSKCFIATAACGTDQADDVVRLREFRDNILRRNRLGRSFIGLYELFSPPIARIIGLSAFSRLLVRKLIVKPVRHLFELLQKEKDT